MNAHADRATHAEAIADAIEGAIHLVDNLEAAETLATLADQWRLEIPTNDAQRPSDATETPEPHTDPTETRENAREAHSDDERVRKYAGALNLRNYSPESDWSGWTPRIRNVMAVADAETAELRAIVKAQGQNVSPMAYRDAMSRGEALQRRALKAELERDELRAEIERLRLAKGPALFEETMAAVLARAEAAEGALAVERARVARVEEALAVIDEVAYMQIGLEKVLTLLPIGPHRAQVPPHWQEEAKDRARPFREHFRAALDASEGA